MMSRVLIALAALLFIGAALTSPSEAQGSWTCTFDFANGQQGWTLVAGTPGTYSGGAFTTTDQELWGNYWRAVFIDLSFASTTLTSVSMSYSRSAGTYNVNNEIAYIGHSNNWNLLSSVLYPSSAANPYSWSGSQTATGVRLLVSSSINSSASYSGSASITSVVISGTGTQPSNCPQAPTNTPTPVPPTNTPAPPTNTPRATPAPIDAVVFAQSNWSCPFDFRRNGLQGWQINTGTMIPSYGVKSVQGSVSIQLPMSAGTSLYDIRLEYESTANTQVTFKADGNRFNDPNGQNAGSNILWWQDNQVFNSSFEIQIQNSALPAGDTYIQSVKIQGYGGSPPCSNSGIPRPTPTAFDVSNLWTELGNANNSINGLSGTNLNSGVPNETGSQLFGYAKWLLSPSSADELAGPFAPLISHTGIAVTLLFGLVLIYSIVWAIIWILRLVVWLYRLIVQIIDLVLQVAQVIGSAVGQLGQAIGGFIGGVVKFLF